MKTKAILIGLAIGLCSVTTAQDAEENDVLIIIQINGKKKAEMKVVKNSTESEIYNAALNIKNIKKIEKDIKKKIFVPNKILNIVI